MTATQPTPVCDPPHGTMRGRGRTLLGVPPQSMDGAGATASPAVFGAAATVIDILHRGGFRYHTEGLRQYLAIRLGSVEAAATALDELRTTAATGSDMAAPPGIRARLYRMARTIAARRLAEEGEPVRAQRRAELPWRASPGSRAKERASDLKKLRLELGDDDAELLELRHARELDATEAAFALDLPLNEIETRYAAALSLARAVLRGRYADPALSLERLLLEAFALEPEGKGRETSGQKPLADPLRQGTVIGGRYAIRSQVGSGTFAHVYRAEDTDVPGHVVALKLLHQPSVSDETKTAALRELHLIASVFHPSLVQFKDHGWYEGRLWFVMPWYDGESLETRMDEQALTRVEARRIFEPLARALATMHAAGIRHQDVKPDNIFLANIRSPLGFGSGEGQNLLPVLLDLGVAAKEAEMIIAGTPNYFAPEVAGKFALFDVPHEVTAKADVYSLALSLRNALEPKTREEVVAGAVEGFIKHRAVNPPPLPRSKDLTYLNPSFERWLNPDPGLRPTAEQFAEELALLTRPEERRQQRLALVRWLAPSIIALAAVFVSVVYVLGTRAARERLGAVRARMDAAELKENLAASEEQRDSLESDVQALQEQYRAGQMTRGELASQLARADGQTRSLRQSLTANERLRRSVSDELAKSQGELSDARANLGKVRADLEGARQRVTNLDAELAGAHAELAETRDDAEQIRREQADIKGQLGNLRAQLTAEKARSERLQEALATAAADKARLETEFVEARRRPARTRAGAATDSGGNIHPGANGGNPPPGAPHGGGGPGAAAGAGDDIRPP